MSSSNTLPVIRRQKRSDSQYQQNRQQQQEEFEPQQSQTQRGYHTQRSISMHHNGSRPLYNQIHYDPTMYREFKKEKLDREESEKEALNLRNRIIMLQKQKLAQERKLKGAYDQATKLYQMKKQIQQEKEQRELRKLQLMEEKEIDALKVKERKQASQQNKADQKLKDKQLKQLEVFRIKQQALVDKKKRQKLQTIQHSVNQQKRDQRLYYEKSISQQKRQNEQLMYNNDERIQEKIDEEKSKNYQIKGYLNQLENIEMQLLENLKQTKSTQKQIEDKIKYAYSQDYNTVKQAFPDINRRMNTRYEDIYSLQDYQSPYNQDYIKSTLPKYELKPKFDMETLQRTDGKGESFKDLHKNNNTTTNKPVSLYTQDYKQKQQQQDNEQMEQIPVQAEN